VIAWVADGGAVVAATVMLALIASALVAAFGER
jgi:hypothetical protein